MISHRKTASLRRSSPQVCVLDCIINRFPSLFFFILTYLLFHTQQEKSMISHRKTEKAAPENSGQLVGKGYCFWLSLAITFCTASGSTGTGTGS